MYVLINFETMNKNIFDKTIAYLESMQVQIGDNLYFDELPKQFEQVSNAVQSNTEINMATKQEIEQIIATNQIAAEMKVQKIVHQVSNEIVSQSLNINEDWAEAADLTTLEQQIKDCQKCPLANTRGKFVFGVGNPNADIMIIGEAPGADEDAQGEPFVGRAGQLLTKIIEAINFKREDVYICNIIKCRPPANRRPTQPEVAHCEPYLKKQIELIKPKYILALGLTAADTLFKKPHKMGDIRGKVFTYAGIPTLVTYHPAALLRNPAWKKPVWEDVQLLRKMYDDNLESDSSI